MSNRSWPVVLVAVALLLAAVPAALAEAKVVECTVVNAADGKLTVLDKMGGEHTLPVASGTAIALDGSKCKLEDLKKDYRAKLTVSKEGENVEVIRIEARRK